MNRQTFELLISYITELRSAASHRVWLALVLMSGVALTEGVGLLLLVPLFGVVGLDVDQGEIGDLARRIFDTFASLGIRPGVAGVLGVYMLTISAQALLRRWQEVVSSDLDESFLLHLRRRLYQAVLNTRWASFTRHRASNFMHALTTELDRVGEISYSLFSLVIRLLVTAAYVLFALHLSPLMTGIAAISGSSLLLVLRRYTRRAHATGEEITRATEALFAATTQHLEGFKTTKSYGAEDRNFGVFSSIGERVARAEVEATRSYADAGAWFKIGSVLILSLIVYIAVQQLRLSTAEILLLLFLFSRLVPKFSGIQDDLQDLLNALPAYANVRGLIASCEATAEFRTESPDAATTPAISLEHGIQLESVSFRYPEGADCAIHDLRLFIPARRTTAITGPSGAGKTTIADLVMGLLFPDRGRVLVDGIPLDPKLMRAWRRQIGYVAQDTVLFHDSVRANLRWACPGAEEDEMWEALRLAAAADFVERLPHGLDTMIGDRGVRLSGGERQRIALARALLRRPALLILDEATNALDSENERRIQDAIDRLHGELTILLITHRLATIRNADVIYVFESGRVVECGRWEELISSGDRFAQLCQIQGLPATLDVAAHASATVTDPA